MSNIKVKICGLTSKEAVRDAVDAGADLVGFVFFPPSPRHVSPEKAAQLAAFVPSHVETVAVTVNASDDELQAILEAFKPDYIQLHGQETIARVQEVKQKFGVKLIKAISVRESDDVASGAMYAAHVERLLFDAKAPASSVLPGGNGLRFDWNLLKDRTFSVPWMLSGGLNDENVKEALIQTGAKMVDVSSAVESEPGVKDAKLVKAFIEAARK